jgi:hypothetical protein
LGPFQESWSNWISIGRKAPIFEVPMSTDHIIAVPGLAAQTNGVKSVALFVEM